MIRRPVALLWKWWCGVAQGQARARALLLLSLALALETADLGAVGAVGGELERAFYLSNTQLGLLAAVPAVCAAVATLPMGVMADRTVRVRLLWIAMLAWSGIEAASAVAWSYE